ncbi:hypothetical protein BH10PSE14_BH10PSE14_35230 [soil metagenome]
MSLFKRLMVGQEDGESVKLPPLFRMTVDQGNDATLSITLHYPGSWEPPQVVWTRSFNSLGDLRSVLAHIRDADIEIAFWGRLVLLLGPSSLDADMDRIVDAHHERIVSNDEKRRRQAAARRRVQSYARDKNGWYYLTLQRETDDEPEWSIAFRGKAERERLRDWFRWQSSRFLEFLDYADEHGGAALEKRLLDEMFATEQRVKQEGHGAGGARPLRMWRGE